MGNASSSATLWGAQSLGASGRLSASTQSGRASQNFAAVVGIFMREYENRDINAPEIRKAIESLSVALDNDRAAVDLSFIGRLPDWKRCERSSDCRINRCVPRKRSLSVADQEAIDARKAKQAGGAQTKLVAAEPAELVAAAEAAYLRNTKNWALFVDGKSNSLYFAVRGTSTAGGADVVDNVTNVDAEAMLTMDFDTGSPAYTASPSAQPLSRASVPNPVHSSRPNPVHSSREQDLIDPVPRAEISYAEWLAEAVGRHLAVQSGRKDVPPFSPLPFLYPGGELVLLDEGGEVVAKMEAECLSAHVFLDLSAHSSSECQRIVDQLVG
ncbi:hypothetical protein GLOTRDRAFT_133585 [Gloeophyllum trabeum ATCC 11539]|uniref:Uncharacterized protein n=1 Tax=Gloeophyllum trabeum (strain ATCC 11539 / FP-39264 / Madison 617) TaxID=670483 RepID=S7PSP5_GLOTA|nr:uncharacterized protein GLOTRDRAFT_133585 [Gloeophyllum trabeum ATCC 11539]EPQ50841.1 hypothetical protein GLOTRDRAFT_133585 [Gloeophyllum trabeum ATCC 11539]